MNETVGAVYDPGKDYELIIPSWHAAIPASWSLQTRVQGEYQPAAGRTIELEYGDRLRNGHTELMQGMLNQQFIQEVQPHADSQ
jgi:hypothetical protein